MSKIGISIKLDLKKIDKERLFAAQSGALYLDLTMFLDPNNEGQYGDHGFVTQSTTKEEREQQVQMPILGNGKIFYGLNDLKGQSAPQQAPQQPAQAWQQQPQRPQAPQQPVQQGAYNANQQGVPQQNQPNAPMQQGQGFNDFDSDIPF